MSTLDAVVSTDIGYLATDFRTQIITDFSALREMSLSWDRLWIESPSATIFQTLPWMSAWWKAFGKQLELCTLVVHQGGDIVGILPLVRSGASLRFLGSPGADYCDILCEEGLAPKIIEAALRTLFKVEGWRTCRFANLRDDSTFIRYSKDLPRDILKYLHFSSSAHRSSLRLDGDRNAVIDAMRRKSALRRHRNKLQKTGSVRFFHLQDRAQMHHYLNTLFQQHIGRRALANEASQFLSPEWREFYHAMVDELFPRDFLRFSILELDGRPIACHFGFEWKDNLTLYKPSFDVGLFALSPGDVLLSEMLAYARDRELNEVDFTVGSESYKEHFTNQTKDMYSAVLDRAGWWTDICRVFHPLQESLIDRLRRSSWKESASRSLRRMNQRYRELVVAASLQHKGRHCILYKHTGGSSWTDTNVGWSVRSETFTDLTELAMQYPDAISARSLQLYLARLHRGHECFLFRNDRMTSIAWVRTADVLITAETVGPATRTVKLLDDECALDGAPSSAAYGDVLHWFIGYAEATRSVACVCAPRWTLAFRRFINQEGFAPWPHARLVQYQELGRKLLK